ncbi:MAG: DUF6291 domain-containing protein [Muribaculaceae bacterium]|nr:DUF6291 domain-containing protein [Muribaculaceae bacterium]
MKQIIIEQDWLEILNEESPEFLARVMSAIYAFFITGTEPTDFSQAERIAFKLILKNIHRYQEQYDIEAGYEAEIKRRRTERRRQERRAMELESRNKAEAGSTLPEQRLIEPVEPEKPLPVNPLKNDPPATVDFSDGELDYYVAFSQFHNDYQGPKDECQLEYARFKHQFGNHLQETGKLREKLLRFYSWRKTMAKKGYATEPLPTLKQWVSSQAWRQILPEDEADRSAIVRARSLVSTKKS